MYHAQQLLESDFDHYTKKDGLSHNIVTGLAQDSTGYIWIATAYGLNRYNGSSFVQFHSSDDSLSLSSENLLGMTWLDKERLAITTARVYILLIQEQANGTTYLYLITGSNTCINSI